jgi:hypothetical protein
VDDYHYLRPVSGLSSGTLLYSTIPYCTDVHDDTVHTGRVYCTHSCTPNGAQLNALVCICIRLKAGRVHGTAHDVNLDRLVLCTLPPPLGEAE